jgi:hypothetical protein
MLHYPVIAACATIADCDDAIERFFLLFPTLEPLSLDEFLHEHWETLPQDAVKWCRAMIEHYEVLTRV